MYALKLLYEWRDQIAREKDESTGSVKYFTFYEVTAFIPNIIYI